MLCMAEVLKATRMCRNIALPGILNTQIVSIPEPYSGHRCGLLRHQLVLTPSEQNSDVAKPLLPEDMLEAVFPHCF